MSGYVGLTYDMKVFTVSSVNSQACLAVSRTPVDATAFVVAVVDDAHSLIKAVQTAKTHVVFPVFPFGRPGATPPGSNPTLLMEGRAGLYRAMYAIDVDLRWGGRSQIKGSEGRGLRGWVGWSLGLEFSLAVAGPDKVWKVVRSSDVGERGGFIDSINMTVTS